jgi:putative NIF3 family GTP cyclohydrolase 1 type 2
LSGEAIHFGKLYALESEMNLILAGHYATELPGVQRVLDRIKQHFDIETAMLADPVSASIK